MAILINPLGRKQPWMAEFGRLLPDDELWLWPDVPDAEAVEFLIGWLMPRAAMQSFTNLRAVFSLGAGAEQWQKPGMPDVPIVRLADPAMSNEMAAYAVAWVVRHQRRFAEAERWQRGRQWKIPDFPETARYRVGILGYGTIGARIGESFADLGYPVSAWTRTPRAQSHVTAYAGLDQLDDFLGACDAVVAVLPSTPETTALLDADRFAAFVPGSLFMNIGRGTLVADEAELIAALDAGRPAAAVLDVTNPEPPDAASPLFDHPAVTLTAHFAGMTQITSGAALVAANIERIRRGEQAFPLVDRNRGY